MMESLPSPLGSPAPGGLLAAEAAVASSSLFQEELVAAIHAAFTVAAEIAVREVRARLAGRTEYEELRRENRSLKEQLQRAEEALLLCGGWASGDTEDTAEVSEARACAVKLERGAAVEPDLGALSTAAPAIPDLKSGCQQQQLTVKEEREEEDDCGGTSCSVDSVRGEALSVGVEERTGAGFLLEIRSRADSSERDSSRIDEELQSFSSDFLNTLHPGEPAASLKTPAGVHGIQIRAGWDVGPPSEPVHVCELCGQSFALPSLLRRHHGQCHLRLQQRQPLTAAAGDRSSLQPGRASFCCSVCGREFNRMENLRTHLRIHTGERPYTCAVCSKCFRHSGALTRHFRIHTGEKPYVCAQCGKCFRNCGGLKFHQRSHDKGAEHRPGFGSSGFSHKQTQPL